MAVFKIEKNKNYTIMSNHHLRDKSLSYKAKGLLSFMLSLPEDWDYSINGLVKVSKEGKKAIRAMLEELEENHYLIRKRIQLKNGQFDYEYHIYEMPYNQKGNTDEGNTEEDTEINTNIININKQNDKEDRPKTSFFDAEKHNRLTLELIDRGYIAENDIQLYFYDNLFNELLKEHTYIDLITVLHYILARVKWCRFRDEDGNIIENKYGYLKEAIYNNLKIINTEYEELW